MSLAPKTFCTTREAASLLGVSVSTIQNWAEAGLIESWKTEGGHRRIARESVTRLLSTPSTHRAVSSATHLNRPLKTPRLRILIVEDDPSLLRLYEIRMATWPMKPIIDIAGDGFEALVKIGLRRPDLLITDLDMPDINGARMISALREMPDCADIKIVVISGQTAESASADPLPADIPVFCKPAPYAELERIAAQVLEAKQQRQSP